MVILVAIVASVTVPLVYRNPVTSFRADDTDASDEVGGQRPVVIENTEGTAIDVFWWDADREVEEHLMSMPPDDQITVYAGDGDIIVFRRADDGDHLRSVLLTGAILDGEAPIYPVLNDPFFDEYMEKNGIPWLNVYPRDPVALHMYGGDTIGTKEHFRTTFGYWGNDTAGIAPLDLEVETISTSPRIVRIDNLLSPEECTAMVAAANSSFERSQVSDSAFVSEAMYSEDRTSSSFFMAANVTPGAEHVTRRILDLMRFPFAGWEDLDRRAEIFQMLHYGPGQEYRAHTDWFAALGEDNCHDSEILRGRNRFATVFIYLSDVEEGGETAFPLAKGFEYEGSVDEACTYGFRVRPKLGSAIIFYSMLPDGNLDELSLHSGCPVVSGEKYAANAWFWEPTRYSS
ncbi:unnamed protein product (mitochondrion) [Plasmodiophora brassicae]|uniref:Fe2OG dioxygenase domain-containing protein n=2 Tax=Plasmodiophora brassicae TaxID=37360 RepID=A0A3P3YNA0_PLABS|nr:unnamed protein product [Plasmodiophora brassicae]